MALEGNPAPNFTLMNQDEVKVTLADLVQKGPVMLVFYPGDFTPVCTKQLCGYQEALERFVQYGITVVGISGNPPESHQRFKSQYRLTFDLLSDPRKEVTKTYGVTSLFLLGGTSRAVFVLSKGGKVLYRYVEPTTMSHRRPEQLLKILDGLRQTGRL